MKKMRADARMVELNLVPSREKAQRLIFAGSVFIGSRVVSKASELIDENAQLTIKAAPDYVSRGYLKLEKALEVFALNVSGAVAADIGASTGGFTQCLLNHGAKKVYAIDVGYGQLDWTLRNDPRVAVLERTNARNMAADWFETPLTFASIDVSFISIRLILPALRTCLAEGAHAVSLIKPQFEAGRESVGKHGVVKDAKTHEAVLETAIGAARAAGYSAIGLDFSPIKGPKGNIEFLLHVINRAGADSSPSAAEVVQRAHEALKGPQAQ